MVVFVKDYLYRPGPSRTGDIHQTADTEVINGICNEFDSIHFWIPLEGKYDWR